MNGFLGEFPNSKINIEPQIRKSNLQHHLGLSYVEMQRA